MSKEKLTFKTCILGTKVGNSASGYCLVLDKYLKLPYESNYVQALVPFPVYDSGRNYQPYIKSTEIKLLDFTVLDKKPFTEYTKYEMDSANIDPLYEDLLFTTDPMVASECIDKLYSQYSEIYHMVSPKIISSPNNLLTTLISKAHSAVVKPSLSIARATDVVPNEVMPGKDALYVRVFDNNIMYIASIFSNKKNILDIDGSFFKCPAIDRHIFSIMTKALLDKEDKEVKEILKNGLSDKLKKKFINNSKYKYKKKVPTINHTINFGATIPEVNIVEEEAPGAVNYIPTQNIYYDTGGGTETTTTTTFFENFYNTNPPSPPVLENADMETEEIPFETEDTD